MSSQSRTRWWSLLAAGIVGAAVAMLVYTLLPGAKKLDRQVERLYGVEDPQFLRAMGVLLGPAIVPGNRVETLLNGDEIFPAMLAAIAARADDHVRDLHLLVGRRSARSSPTRSPSARAPA